MSLSLLLAGRRVTAANVSSDARCPCSSRVVSHSFSLAVLFLLCHFSCTSRQLTGVCGRWPRSYSPQCDNSKTLARISGLVFVALVWAWDVVIPVFEGYFFSYEVGVHLRQVKGAGLRWQSTVWLVQSYLLFFVSFGRNFQSLCLFVNLLSDLCLYFQ